MDLRATLEELQTRALGAIQRVGDDRGSLARLRDSLLGRKGELTEAIRRLAEAAPAERAGLGELAANIKSKIEAALITKEPAMGDTGSFDSTLDPLLTSGAGHLNPLTLTRCRLEDICERMGFTVVEGPEVESEYYNFDCLNTPADHPARDIQDTFWLADKEGDQSSRLVLRTQTSSQQVRALRTFGAPFYGVFPGRVFRNEATDARHEMTFDQLEGLVVAKSISVSHLLGVLEEMLNQFFGREMRWRVRPGYFPFVEPGLELDAACLCGGDDSTCRLCHGSGWLEMLGCGLVHPTVLQAGGLDPAEWSGFAFGLGISRLAMLAYGINDIRLLSSNDWRFMRQFPSSI